MPTSLSLAKIRGVRSYSPQIQKTQTIEFMPLTLIVGSNGSGKTTIIESLKFIISGDEPPLSDSRRNFLHTSRSISSSDCKKNPYASIEIHFQNSKDESCIAKRDILKPSSGSNQTAAVVSSYKIGNKNWTNVHKQTDWSTTVPFLFNLPNQAILNNVILCHQEDNQWCMGDSSSVKQVLDKIFGCERYKKEIKFIEAEIKNCRNELTLGEKDSLLVKEKVNRKNELTNELDNLVREIATISQETQALDKKVEQVAQEQNSLMSSLKELENYSRDLETLKRTLYETTHKEKAVLISLDSMAIDPLVISDQELGEKMKNHSLLIEQTKNKQSELKEKEQNIRLELKTLESERDSLQDVINKLKVIELKSRETYQTLLAHLERIKDEQSVDQLLPGDIEFSLKVLDKLSQELQQRKSDRTELEDNLSSKQQQLSREIATLEGIYQGLLQKIKNKELFVEKLSDQLAQTDPIAQDLVHVTENLIKMSSILRQMEESIHVSNMKDLINDSTGTIKKIVHRIKNENLMKITSEIDRENTEIQDNKQQLYILDKRRKDLTSEQLEVETDHNRVRTASKEAHNKVIIFENARTNILDTYKKYQNEILFLETKNMTSKMIEYTEVMNKIESKREDLSIFSSEYSKISEIISSSFEQYEEFKKNFELRELRHGIEKIQEQIARFQGNTDIDIRLKENRMRLEEVERKAIDLRDRRSRIAGSKSRIEREIANIKSELTRHTNTYSNYSQCLGKIVCNKIVISDLEKLKECFQKSVSNFHSQMILKINEVLKARWRQIYTGSDINHIELVDEEMIKGKDKKVSNYYVAMFKNGQRMKMREKGSAGQKALASIILRMTLAELFVKDFAFIALDEPTANLDLSNVQSLAKTIGSYVKRRTKRGINIQWIIITHDENFLRALDSESSPYYYKIHLDSEGHSKIVKISYQEASSSNPGSLESTQVIT